MNKINKELRGRKPVELKTTSDVVRVHEKLLDAIMKKKKREALKMMEQHILEVVDSYRN